MVLLDVVYNHFGPDGQLPARLRPAVLRPDAPARPGARRINFDGEHSAHGAPLLRRQRAVLARGVPLRRPAPRRRARHRRHARPRTSSRRSPQPCATARVDSARCTWCWRTTTTRARCLRARRQRPSRASRPRSGTTTCTTPPTCWPPASATATTRDYADAPLGQLGAGPGRGLRLPGRSRSPHRGGTTRGEPSAHLPLAGLRRLPAEPRPDRQPRLRRAARRAGRSAGARRVRSPACCSRRRCRCCSWARSSPRRTPFLYFCDFDGRSRARRCTAGRRQEFAACRGLRRGGRSRTHSRPERRGHLRGLAAALGRCRERGRPTPPGAVPRLLGLRSQHLQPHLPGAARGWQVRCATSSASVSSGRWASTLSLARCARRLRRPGPKLAAGARRDRGLSHRRRARGGRWPADQRAGDAASQRAAA